MAKHVPLHTVYEHAQDDNGNNCGRACVQMIISSLTLGPAAGDPIPFTQDDLRQREVDSKDVDGSWKTHPDELLALLAGAKELAGTPFTNWALSVHGSLNELYAALILALSNRMPAVLPFWSTDHWAVVVGLGVDDATSDLTFIEVLDPAPPDTTPPRHTYIDNCGSLDDGLTIADPLTYWRDQLGTFDLEIGPTRNPNGMNDYSGKFLAVVHGRPGDDSIKSLVDKFKRYPVEPRPIVPMAAAAGPIDPQKINAMREALLFKAESWRIPQLTALLTAPHAHAVRLVQDLESTLSPYYLLSLFSPTLSYGVVAVFDGNGRVPLHFRFTKDRRFEESLNKRSSEPLWWSRKRLPLPRTPYFPVARQVVDNKVVYQRLVDDFTFELGV